MDVLGTRGEVALLFADMADLPGLSGMIVDGSEGRSCLLSLLTALGSGYFMPPAEDFDVPIGTDAAVVEIGSDRVLVMSAASNCST